VALEQAEVAEAAGAAIASLARSLRAHRVFRQSELEWQIERTLRVLEKLMAAEQMFSGSLAE
jgi:hypothetical protein